MPRAMTDFPSSDAAPLEIANYSFDFAHACDTGETLTSSVWTIFSTKGIDLAPANTLVGPPENEGTITTQAIGNMVVGETYRAQATVTTSEDQTLTLYATIVCIPIS